jgi:hypothetical protein
MEAFELRLWDGRLGRWLTVDPYYEFSSPYLGMGNNPISLIDPDGGIIQPALGIDMVRYQKYITLLMTKYPKTYAYLQNHPAIITVYFKKELKNSNAKGNTSVNFFIVKPNLRELTAKTYMMNSNGYPIGVLDFEFYDKDYRGIITNRKNPKLRTVNLPEAMKLFNSPDDQGGLGASIKNINIEIRDDATFSTVAHEFDHALFALQNPFNFFMWSLIEKNWHNPSLKGDMHFPGNPTGISADNMSTKVKSECNCDN